MVITVFLGGMSKSHIMTSRFIRLKIRVKVKNVVILLYLRLNPGRNTRNRLSSYYLLFFHTLEGEEFLGRFFK